MTDEEHAQEAENPPEPASDPPADAKASDDATEAVRDPAARERSREAASYRVRLREAEGHVAERDGVIAGLREEVDRLHRLEAEQLAGDLATPADLWLATDLGELRDDDGRVDAEKVAEKVREVLADHPGWRKRSVGFDGGARRTPEQARRPGLADLLKPERTR